MAEGSAQYHEPAELLGSRTKERHRAIVSLIEELEAVDWYQQRIDASDDEALKAVLAHNRDEEKEHAAMSLEWLRRQDPDLDARLRTYLFTGGPITEIEEGGGGRDGGRSGAGAGAGGAGGGGASRAGAGAGAHGGGAGSGGASASGSLGIGSLKEKGRTLR